MKVSYFILFIFLFSCKKENIYYYANNVEIKDSSTIKLVNIELEKRNVDFAQEKDLKIYTSLDSISYKSNIDSIRNDIFKKSLKPELKPSFDDWFREKIIVMDNKTGKIIHYYNSFNNPKYDRFDIHMLGAGKMISLGSMLMEYPNAEIPSNYLYLNTFRSFHKGKSNFEINKIEKAFLNKIEIQNLNANDYLSNDLSFFEALDIFQVFSNKGIINHSFLIEKIVKEDKIIYAKKNESIKILEPSTNAKIDSIFNFYKDHRFNFINQKAQNIQKHVFFGTSTITLQIFTELQFTYLVYISSAIPTDLKLKKFQSIPNKYVRFAGIRYYNAIQK